MIAMTEATILLGSGGQMGDIRDGEAALILTSPPYFPDDLEARLRTGGLSSEEVNEAESMIREYALSLRPVFAECARVLRPSGALILQTRDVRLEDRLVAVEQIHRMLIEALGFVLYTRHLWRPRYTTRVRAAQLREAKREGAPRAFDPEVFLVFKRPGQKLGGAPLPEDLERLASDISSSAVGKLPVPHRFQAPIPMLQSLIRCWTKPEDLVVDPFAGGGTTLVVAQRLGRPAIGYEISPEVLAQARRNLESFP